MTPEEGRILSQFPNLKQEALRITSPKAYYNCFAWAANDNTQCWGTDSANGDYWPTGVPKAYTVDAFLAAFSTLGFVRCSSGEQEKGVEKLAIYLGQTGEPEHMARQLPSGWWTSKIGWALEDIEHETLKALECDDYGTVQVFLSRQIPTD